MNHVPTEGRRQGGTMSQGITQRQAKVFAQMITLEANGKKWLCLIETMLQVKFIGPPECLIITVHVRHTYL